MPLPAPLVAPVLRWLLPPLLTLLPLQPHRAGTRSSSGGGDDGCGSKAVSAAEAAEPPGDIIAGGGTAEVGDGGGSWRKLLEKRAGRAVWAHHSDRVDCGDVGEVVSEGSAAQGRVRTADVGVGGGCGGDGGGTTGDVV